MTTLIRTLIALLLILAGGEIFVRLFVNGPSPQTYDPEIGYSYIPHGELFQTKEGRARVRFNELGLNDAEVGPRDARCRVLVVGDSYTTALQVPSDKNFGSVAERLDPGLDIVNGGRDGLFLGDAHKVIRRLVPLVKPDFVVYVISEGDVNDDTQLPGFRVNVDPSTGKIVDAVMQVEGKETFKEIFGALLNESALMTRLSAQLQPSAATAAEMFASLQHWSAGSTGAATVASSAPARPATEDILAFVFHRLAASAPTAILYINVLRYQPDHRASVAPRSQAAEVVARAAADRASLKMLDTAPYLIESVIQKGQPPFGFDNGLLPGGHLNPQGHEAVARALVDLVHEMQRSGSNGCHTQ